jgi:molybdopterin-dependent oxidoreductase alpha subunit
MDARGADNSSPARSVSLPVFTSSADGENLRVSTPATSAAGPGGVGRTLRHLLRQMNPLAAAKVMRRLNQKGGIDCMSCAWPEPDGDRSHFEFCENGAKAVASEATSTRATPELFAQYSVAELSAQSDYWLGQTGRITHPMLLGPGATHYQPIEWDQAFALIARELNSLESPDEAIFYSSGRTSNEAAFLYQLFVRMFGTNNLPDCSNMCHESSGTALGAVIGVGKGTVTLEDFEKTQTIVVIGQNPGTNHPRMLSTLQRAKRRGAAIISINPLAEAGLVRFRNPQEMSGWLGRGTALTDLFLQVRINGDLAVLKGIIKELIERDAVDTSFIEKSTTGFDAFAQAVREHPWEPILESSGISRDQIHRAADLLAKSDRIIVCWAMGLTQHTNAVTTIREIVNLLLLRGSIGKPGAGTCPVRGHSNVQGARTMGIHDRPRRERLDRLRRCYDFEPPQRQGLDTVNAIRAMHAGLAKVFISLGGNFLSAAPDTAYTAEALAKTRLTVQISTKLNRSHLITGQTALILPCLGRTEIDVQRLGEQFVSTENSMGVVEMSRGVLPPASHHLRSEPAIVARLAHAVLGPRPGLDWHSLIDNYDRIRDEIAKVIPGFEDYNRRVRRPGGFYLPNAAREGTFDTPSGKAIFTIHRLPDNRLEPDQFVMMTIRSHDQFNTTIYATDDDYRGIHNARRVILMNEQDMQERSLNPGQYVNLVSHFQGQKRFADGFRAIPFQIPRRCAATYFPEANVLVPIDSVAEESNTPTSKYVVITVHPSSC